MWAGTAIDKFFLTGRQAEAAGSTRQPETPRATRSTTRMSAPQLDQEMPAHLQEEAAGTSLLDCGTAPMVAGSNASSQSTRLICRYCPKSFVSAGSLKTHVNKMHQELNREYLNLTRNRKQEEKAE